MDRPDIDFLIIGAAKCSTTWLHASLQQSPNVFMADGEPHFFSRYYDRGFDWYAEQFPEKRSGLLFGEKSNSYMSEPEAARRIHDAYPQARLVALLRNPTARAYSDYCMLYRRGTVGAEIDDYLDPDRAEFRRFIDDGLYARQLARFLELFPREQLLILIFEEFRRDPQPGLDRLARHLGQPDGSFAPFEGKVKDRAAAMVPRPIRAALKPLRPILDPIRATGPIKALRGLVARQVSYPPFKPELARRLDAYYAADIRDLEALCGRRIDGWHDAATV
ncbi:sulfotransferase family protein [Jannaschia ovalis]|uniref:Sulfotransferase n=1 Tax=Jannaschia ovalis TaxID=3038773 RepID=A0ABY8LEW9_9RHOB|nr:sulfotransferase [Jannaschia sp. GRR-S6-38]WGH78718.1 sulfotransferase [Jannaschia sp. GRR-S6-38]